MVRTSVLLPALALGAMVVGSIGCADRARMAEISKRVERNQVYAGSTIPTMTEITHDGKLYVVGSAAGAETVKSGKKLKNTVKGFGMGPKGETVVFEHDGKLMADILQDEYAAKYAK